MQTTTQPATTHSVDKGARGIFEGIQFFQKFLRRQLPTELTREQHKEKYIKESGCNCGGTCGYCTHLIRDIFGD